ncbi:hypothetical protein KCM76_06485 [Zooshikella marina]|uniref:hypothetical protein n=1 Tax=Zooshikella ganghwensis TaxID=202772 RepID=UPI001BB05DE0|nr:hypothetical protein [Zooshikella ganghwensis]MBU2705619.1 hypothetical protein [Zooshikella ganghwensis]
MNILQVNSIPSYKNFKSKDKFNILLLQIFTCFLLVSLKTNAETTNQTQTKYLFDDTKTISEQLKRLRTAKRLSDTGLYLIQANTNLKQAEINPAVDLHIPIYPLFSDGERKQRHIYLPPGAQIDAININNWHFPVGTVFWKSFSNEDRYLETRIAYKISLTGKSAKDRWEYKTYQWNEEQTNAFITPEDQRIKIPNTLHTIPKKSDCESCHISHNDYDFALGFDTIQLSVHPQMITGGINLVDLWFNNRIKTNDPKYFVQLMDYQLPGSLTEKWLTGYMHTNCGSCHNSYKYSCSSDEKLNLRHRLPINTNQLNTANKSNVLLSSINKTMGSGYLIDTHTSGFQRLLNSDLYLRVSESNMPYDHGLRRNIDLVFLKKLENYILKPPNEIKNKNNTLY